MKKNKLFIAVIGKSSSGKSAFIKSFSQFEDKINSEGRGQTTRSYAEYNFYLSKFNECPKVSIKLMTKEEFVNIRINQLIERTQKLYKDESKDESEFSLKWLSRQFADEDYKNQIDSYAIYSDDFFNINEFKFLDEGQCIQLILEEYEKYISLVKFISESDLAFGSYYNDEKVNEMMEATNNYHKLKELEADNGDMEVFEKIFSAFFESMFDFLLDSIRNKYKKLEFFVEENGFCKFEFNVTDDLKDLLTLFLKVIKINREPCSLTGLVSRAIVNSAMKLEYIEIFKSLNIDSVTLLDTYGLDHEQTCDDEVLIERYNKIFSKDYPEITNVFFVEALHAGSSSDFTRALNILYSERPNIMTYVIGTYIDEQDQIVLNDYNDWFHSLEKNTEIVPELNGKVIDFLYKNNSLSTTLKRNNVHQSLAKKRIEIMRKRFGPFCGDITKTENKSVFREINLVTIKSIFTSIENREHLGDGYINIDNISKSLSDSTKINSILIYMLIYSSKRFVQLFEITAPRTKWKLRENLENHILGFNGSTLNVTWRRVFNESYNQSFAKEIMINEEKISLSNIFGLVGNEKIAFDELLNNFFPFLFNKACETKQLDFWNHEIDCYECHSKGVFDDGCIWGKLINLIGPDNFKSSTPFNSKYRVYDWLCSIHDFSNKIDNSFLNHFYRYFQNKMIQDFIPLCRQHNITVASKKIKKSAEAYLEIKYKVFCEYKDKYDSEICIEDFFERVNK